MIKKFSLTLISSLLIFSACSDYEETDEINNFLDPSDQPLLNGYGELPEGDDYRAPLLEYPSDYKLGTLCNRADSDSKKLTVSNELYVFDEINKDLNTSSEMKNLLGFDKVSTCAEARSYVTLKNDLNEENHILNTDDDIHLNLDTSILGQVMNGTDSSYRSSVALYIRQASGYDDQILCSGNIIAPNVISTAAHCLYQNGRRPVTVVYTPTTGSSPITVYGSINSRTPNITGYRHPSYTGTAEHDIAIIVLDSNLPSPANGSEDRSRMMVNNVWKNMPITFYGYGHTQHPGSSAPDEVGNQHKGNNTISWRADTYYTYNVNSGPRACGGDSGAGSFRVVSGDFDLMVGIDSQKVNSYSANCPYNDGYLRETTVGPKISWIESIIGSCHRFTSATNTAITYARCW